MKYYGSLLLAIIIWGALTFGGVYPWAYWPMVIGAAGLGVIGLRQTDPHSGWLRWLAVALLALAVGVGFQLIPLPRNLLLVLGPSTDRFLQDYVLGYAVNPSPSHSIAIAPDKTVLGFGLLVGFGIALLGWIRGVGFTDLEKLVRGLIWFGVLLAIFAVVQKGFSGKDGTEYVYGFWKPINQGNPFGPFINRNHFAGWMVMTSAIAMAYAFGLLERDRPRQRGWGASGRWLASPEASQFMLAVLIALVMYASIVISGSRSGIGSFVVAIGVTALFVWRRFFDRLRSAVVIGVVAVGLVAAVVSWAGPGQTVERFSTASEDVGERLGAWRDTTRIIADFPVFGVGLNGYGTAMLQYQTGSRRLFYREAHNDYLQVIAEGGLLLSIPAAIAIGIILYQIWRRFKEDRDPIVTRWIRMGAVAALAGIAAQSLLDFSLQMPGNTALFLAIVAIAVHRPLRSAASLAPPRTRRSSRP